MKDEEMKTVKDAIQEVVKQTFDAIGKVYETQREGVQGCHATGEDSRLIFPRYHRKNQDDVETRISEQELRFLFVEKLLQTLKDNNWFYSVETPTVESYRFTGGKDGRPREDKTGRSARIDLTIYDENLNRIGLIEFKARNPKKFDFAKDFLKLQEEGEKAPKTPTFFIMMVKNANEGTIKSLRNKVYNKDLVPKGQSTEFYCYCLESKECITSKIISPKNDENNK